MAHMIDMTNKRFGMLTAVKPVRRGKGQFWWDCVCDCGNTSCVEGSDLRSGKITSCGCKRFGKKFTQERHGKRNTRLYTIWACMKDRCRNPAANNYRWYGGKGVCVCNEWDRFENFYNWAMENGYQDNLTIDRIDSSGNYCPDNCRWITQSENTRRAHKKEGKCGE